MARFSASDAALEGFRLTRERPGVVLAWAGVYAFSMLMIAVVMGLLIGPDLMQVVKAGGLDDPKALADALMNSAPALIVCLVLVVVLMSVITAGIYRIILRPQEQGFVHLRLGMDELRISLVNLILFSVGFVCLTLALAAAALATAIGPLAEYLMVVAAMIATAWIGVRLSMATPMTFVMRRVTLKDAWLLSRGSFWPLLGMMVLAVIFYLIVYLLLAVIVFSVVAAGGGQEAMADLSHAGPMALIATVASFLLQMVLSVLQVVMIYAPFAVAYEQLHGDLSVDPLRRAPRPQTP